MNRWRYAQRNMQSSALPSFPLLATIIASFQGLRKGSLLLTFQRLASTVCGAAILISMLGACNGSVPQSALPNGPTIPGGPRHPGPVNPSSSSPQSTITAPTTFDFSNGYVVRTKKNLVYRLPSGASLYRSKRLLIARIPNRRSAWAIRLADVASVTPMHEGTTGKRITALMVRPCPLITGACGGGGIPFPRPTPIPSPVRGRSPQAVPMTTGDVNNPIQITQGGTTNFDVIQPLNGNQLPYMIYFGCGFQFIPSDPADDGINQLPPIGITCTTVATTVGIPVALPISAATTTPVGTFQMSICNEDLSTYYVNCGDLVPYIQVNHPAPTGSKAVSAKIWAQINKVKCTIGSGVKGNGCAETVNKVLQAALGYTIPAAGTNYTCTSFPTTPHTCHTYWVPDLVEVLIKHGIGVQIMHQADTVAGDLVVQDGNDPVKGMNHIGFCTDRGCSIVISNEGGKGLLCGYTDVTMSDPGYDYPRDQTPTFYRLNQ